MRSVADALAALNREGFVWVPGPADGVVAYTLLYVRDWPAYMDALHVRAESDVTGIRARSDAHESQLFADHNVVWKYEGDLMGVVAELLKVPAPGEPGAPTRAIAAPTSLWLPPSQGALPTATPLRR
ncbi:hypothetical protein GCM10012275_62590 [Longimycelium tulufanense]|uniref:Uncharacterized protein n=1 Tax=Longimycelium tulufanense TaxID=907463 RepID=A0A8J3CEK5_9PSEU|nr:hypothetical protein [Longimycelium tulufanense]GGM83460.1 hypothetical protein GCM10012275_62590 [Longimycelium tulufanense]